MAAPGAFGLRLLHTPGSVERVGRRVARLTAGTPGRWGRLDAPRMIVHLADQLRMALGELQLEPRPIPRFGGQLITPLIWVLPWPRNIPGAGRGHHAELGSWDSDLAALDAAIHRFVARPLDGAWSPHVAFGPLSGRSWSRLAWRHLDHHLTQFGV